jgi:hypothetical protein
MVGHFEGGMGSINGVKTGKGTFPQNKISKNKMAGLQASNPMRCRMTRRRLSAMVPPNTIPALIPIGVL